MNKQIVCSKLEIIEPQGHVLLRLSKQIVEDTGDVLASEYHRTSFEKGGDVDAQFTAVNAHLAAMGWPAVPDQIKQYVKRVAALRWNQ